MKKQMLFFLGISLCLVETTTAQATTRVDLPAEYVRNNTVGNNSLPDDVQGSPYFTEGFLSGKVVTEQQEAFNAMLRYNGYSDQIEMKEMDKVTSLLKREYISAIIGKDTYEIKNFEDRGKTKQGYFIVLNQGNSQLLLRQQKEFVEGKEANTSYGNKIPPKFVEKTSYYIKKGDKPAVDIKLKKKDILKFFDNQKELVQYVNSNGLKLKSEEEVVKLLAFANQ